MIRAEYVLADDPTFKPTRGLDRSAGYDIRAYLPESIPYGWNSDLTDLIEKSGDFYWNGTLINYGRIAEENLEKSYSNGRFVAIEPGQRVYVSAGFKIGLSTDSPGKIATALVCPRSGLAINAGLTVINSPGIIDEEFPHFVLVGLINHSQNLHLISHGTRIAQLLFVEVEEVEESIVEGLQPGKRSGGFGSTGML